MPTLDPFVTLLDLANVANPSHPVPFTPESVTLAGVEAFPTEDGIVNTKLTLNGVEAVGYSGSVSLYYTRADIGQQMADAGIAPELHRDGLTSWASLFSALNARYRTQLTLIDAVSAAWPVLPPRVFAIDMAPTSLFYTGGFTLTLLPSTTDVPLDQGLAITVLSGLVGP